MWFERFSHVGSTDDKLLKHILVHVWIYCLLEIQILLSLNLGAKVEQFKIYYLSENQNVLSLNLGEKLEKFKIYCLSEIQI